MIVEEYPAEKKVVCNTLFPPANEVAGRYCFTPVCPPRGVVKGGGGGEVYIPTLDQRHSRNQRRLVVNDALKYTHNHFLLL